MKDNENGLFKREKALQMTNVVGPEAPFESVNWKSMPQQKDGPLCISFFPEGKKSTPHHGEPLLVIGMR